MAPALAVMATESRLPFTSGLGAGCAEACKEHGALANHKRDLTQAVQRRESQQTDRSSPALAVIGAVSASEACC